MIGVYDVVEYCLIGLLYGYLIGQYLMVRDNDDNFLDGRQEIFKT